MGRTYRELIAWQKAMELVTNVYQVTSEFPKHEMYGLTSQIRRAAVSVPSNIAEGQARHSQREFMHFLAIARGSLAEFETQLTIAQNLGYVTAELTAPMFETSSHIGCLVNNLYSAIERRTENGERRTQLS